MAKQHCYSIEIKDDTGKTVIFTATDWTDDEVAAVWGKLPDDVQQALFEAGVRSAGAGSREKLAIYLHGRHIPDTGWR
jgi:hypothetical protein